MYTNVCALSTEFDFSASISFILLILIQDDGVDFLVQGRVVNFHGTISVVAADNLASWSLGGYMSLSSATRKCRFCMATEADMKTKVS